MIFKDIAADYIEKGYVVTPVDENKSPHFIQGWQKNRNDDVLNKQYDWAWNKAQGLGLLCGEPSGVICLDIDILENDERLSNIRTELLKILPPLFSGRIGNRKKPPARFFKFSGEPAEKFNNISVELLSTGNQVVLPPSKHPSGVYYEWIEHPLTEIDVEDLPWLDEEILVWLREMNHRMRPNPIKGDALYSTLVSMPGRCKSGSHNYLSKIGVKLRFIDTSFEDVVSRLIDEDKKINSSEACLYFQWRAKFKSSDIEENANRFVKEIFERNQPDQKYKNYPSMKNGFYIDIGEKQPKWIPDYHGFSDYAKKVIHLKCKEKMNYYFNGEFYEPIDKLGIEKFIYDIAGKKLTPHHSGNFVKMARTNCYYHNEFVNPPDKMNLNNGILLKDIMKIVPHDDDEFFTYRIHHDFSEKTETPVFDKFLDLIATCDEQKKQLIMEFIGYIISGCDYSRFNKILVLDGTGANGKTTLINIIQKIVGMKNISSVALDSLKDNRFAASSLVGKLVNFCAEEPKSAFSASAPLKKLTGNDPYEVEFKHQGAFSFINYAKFVISYNEMPFLPDTSSGMARRLIIIPCVTDLEKQPELKIKNIFKKLEPEYGSIIHKCLLAFKLVEARGEFTAIADGIARYKELVKRSDPIVDFVEENLIVWADADEKTKALIIKEAGPFFDAFVSSELLWQEFEKFVGRGHRYRKRGFEMKISQILNKENGVTKCVETQKRGYNGLVLAK